MNATRIPLLSLWTRFLPWAALLAAALAIPLEAVRADIGPKPTMEFEFTMEVEPAPTIVAGELLECSDPQCADAKPLESLGPQGFFCEATSCHSVAYGYQDYHRLRIEFSDGVTRQSNIFTRRSANAHYLVTVRPQDLLVEETGPFWGGFTVGKLLAFLGEALPFAVLCASLLVALPLLVLLVLWIVLEGQGRGGFTASKGLYLGAWALGAPVLVAISFTEPALLATFAVEGALALLFAVLFRRPAITLLTAVLLVNLLTQPALALALSASRLGEYLVAILAVEAFIALVEGTLLFLTHRRSLGFLQGMALALLMNGASFGIGLLLPL